MAISLQLFLLNLSREINDSPTECHNPKGCEIRVCIRRPPAASAVLLPLLFQPGACV